MPLSEPSSEPFANAMAAHQAGSLAEAEALYRRVLAADPNHADALHLLGVIYAQEGRTGTACALIGQAIALRPDQPHYHANLAQALIGEGRLDSAREAYLEALALKPNDTGLRAGLGGVLRALGATAGDPARERALAHHARALALGSRKRGEEAATEFERALALAPDLEATYGALGRLYYAQGRLADAQRAFSAALALAPDDAENLWNLGVTLQEQARYDVAALSYEEAVRLRDAFYPEALVNLGAIRQREGRLEDAMAAYEQAIQSRPSDAHAHANLGMALLARGDYVQGFARYRWRWRVGHQKLPEIAAPLWGGEALDGRTILLHAEQGFGDTLQFVRFAPQVQERGGRVVLQCPDTLIPLIGTAPGVDAVIGAEDPLPSCACHAPLLDLPYLLGTTLDRLPAPQSYLRADEARVAAWMENLASMPGLRVGVAWRGNPEHKNDRARSMTAAQMAACLRGIGAAAVILQRDLRPEEVAALSGGRLVDAGPALSDFNETAALIANLDLVIAVDTAVCHLAGALGRPVWTLLAFDSDWRWLREREDSPWYPAMRLFRQARPGDWSEVAERVRNALADFSSQPRGGAPRSAPRIG